MLRNTKALNRASGTSMPVTARTILRSNRAPWVFLPRIARNAEQERPCECEPTGRKGGEESPRLVRVLDRVIDDEQHEVTEHSEHQEDQRTRERALVAFPPEDPAALEPRHQG